MGDVPRGRSSVAAEETVALPWRVATLAISVLNHFTHDSSVFFDALLWMWMMELRWR